MRVYIVFIILCIILSFAEIEDVKIIIFGRKMSVRVVSALVLSIYLIMLGAVRNPALGVDSDNYKTYCYDIAVRYGMPQNIPFSTDIGFSFLTFLITRIVKSYTAYRIVIYAITITLELYVIVKHSCNIGLSFIIFMSFGFLSFDFSILRQALAVAICFISYDYVIKHRFIPAFILTLIAFSMHKTAAIFVILILASLIKIKKDLYVYLLLIIGAVCAGWFGLDFIINLYKKNNYHQLGITSGQGWGLLLYIVVDIILLGIAINSSNKISNIESQMLFNIIFCSLPIQIIALSFSVFTRSSLYSLIFSTIAFPNAIEDLEKKNRLTFYFVSLIMSVAFTLYRMTTSPIVPYISVFQNSELL